MTALLFPGQGAQAVGMGADLMDSELVTRDIAVVGEEPVLAMREGPAENLQQTSLCQPALFLHSALVLEAAREKIPELSICVKLGLSLGEYSALYAAGALSFEDTLRALKVRGEAMQRACEAQGGAMASVIGLDDGRVEEVCDQARGKGVLQAANYNAPGQVVISGDAEAVARAVAIVKAGGEGRAIPLKVAGAFHSPLMRPACDDLRRCLEGLSFKSGAGTVVSNVTGRFHDPAHLVDTLVEQITAPVRWSQSIRFLMDRGTGPFVEMGSGRVLTGLMKRIAPEARACSAATRDEVQNLVI